MSMFIDPTGDSTYGLAICGRCSRKMRLSELSPDPNSPGLMVCRADLDDYDPYRLPPRAEDQLVLPFNRLDDNLSVTGSASTPALTVSADGQRFLYSFD